MNRRCIVCGSVGAAVAFRKNGYGVWRCSHCGFKYADAPADNDFVRNFYTDDFFEGGHDKFGYSDYAGSKESLLRSFRRKISLIEKWIRRGRVLDVGCASGYFLECLGPGWDPYGCEPSRSMAEIARQRFGDRISVGEFDRYQSEHSFDLITMWDTLDHFVDPRSAVEKVRSLLGRHGFLAINLGDCGSMVARLLGMRWYHFIPPAHLSFFDRTTLSMFLKKNGFTVRETAYLGKYVDLAEIVLNLSFILRSDRLRKRAERLSKASFWNRYIYLNLFDDMTVLAQKAD
ncbi:MAG: methyltransferase domain-containing protein [Deltaproteobacteria bacterium]